MVFSRYLYEKIKSSKNKYVSALLNPDEVEFLNENHIDYYKSGSYYMINSDEVKSLFCHC